MPDHIRAPPSHAPGTFAAQAWANTLRTATFRLLPTERRQLMYRALVMGIGIGCLGLLLAPAALAAKATCATDSVQVGSVCVDLYEASVWEIPAGNTALSKMIKKGTATLSDLSA